jgi:hypothetical protein
MTKFGVFRFSVAHLPSAHPWFDSILTLGKDLLTDRHARASPRHRSQRRVPDACGSIPDLDVERLNAMGVNADPIIFFEVLDTPNKVNVL